MANEAVSPLPIMNQIKLDARTENVEFLVMGLFSSRMLMETEEDENIKES